MTALEFLRTAPVQRVLARAAQSAGTPLSLHYVERNQEGPRILGWGQCAACQHVAGLEGGKAACRSSRLMASAATLRQARPMPFLCHMGFACVAVPAIPEEGFVLTFGPYCPAEEARSLETDVLNGFSALAEETVEALPCELDDIHRAPAETVPAVAEWTAEAIAEQWHAAHEDAVEDEAPAGEEATAGTRKRGTGPVQRMEVLAGDIAAALASGNQPHVRHLLRAVLEEANRRARTRIGVRRARVVAVVSAAFEAAERAQLDTRAAWENFPEFVAAIAAARTDPELLDAGVRVLGIVKRQTQRRRARAEKAPEDGATAKAAVDSPFADLHRIVAERLAEGITLEDVARQLGESPSAISHRLKRTFGMSYSDYVGRLRVDAAKDLLRRTKLTATEVARRVGIRDQSNFGKLFKKFEGMTPLDYRTRYGRKR